MTKPELQQLSDEDLQYELDNAKANLADFLPTMWQYSESSRHTYLNRLREKLRIIKGVFDERTRCRIYPTVKYFNNLDPQEVLPEPKQKEDA